MARKSYIKKKLPSKTALKEVAQAASKPGSINYYGKNTPTGRGALEVPDYEDFLTTPGTGLPKPSGL